MSGQLVTRDGTAIRKGRVSPALRTAIRLIVEDGISVAAAAQRTGYKETSLAVALKKPHVRAERAAVKRAWLDNKTGKAWLVMAQLAEGAASEDVRHKSAKVFLDAAGELDGSAANGATGPRTLVQIVMHHAPEGGQPIPHRLPGVIEAQAIHRPKPDASNFITVGRSDGDQ